jgi:hypothetical protein
MTLSPRHFAGVPLLLLGLALSYAAVDYALEPCPGERIYSVGRVVVSAAFALYFFSSYWLFVKRAAMALGIWTLWAWQLFVLQFFLLPICAELKQRQLLDQWTGVAFETLVTGVIILGGITSYVIFLRYRRSDGWSADARRTFLRITTWGTTILVTLMVAGAYTVIPVFRMVFMNFGADLPEPTLTLFAANEYLALIPLLCIAIGLYLVTKLAHTDQQLKFSMNAAVGLLVFTNVFLSSFVFAVYAPVASMCGCLM